MHALSVRQPFCEMIASGQKAEEYRTWAPRVLVGRDLLIVASRGVEPGGEGLPVGCAICIVRVDAIVASDDGYAWRLSNPRRVEAVPIKGFAALYRFPDEAIRVVSTPIAKRPIATLLPDVSTPRSRKRTARVDVLYTFQDDDRKIRGESATTMSEARRTARRLADKLGDYVFIMREGVNVGGEWHRAKRMAVG